MDEGCYFAEIRLYAGVRAPANWAFCDGSLLQISANNQLFSIIGTTYGGNGISTFALPDLRSRTVVGTGQGQGLPNYVVNQKAGTIAVTMTPSQVPSHTHVIQCNNTASSSNTPEGNFPAVGQLALGQPIDEVYAGGSDSSQMNPDAVSSSGGSDNPAPVSVIQPSMALNYIICTNGLYPVRS